MTDWREQIVAALAKRIETTVLLGPELYLVIVDSAGPSLLRVPVPPEIWAVGEQVGKSTADVLSDIVTTICDSPDGRARQILTAMGGDRLAAVAFRVKGWGMPVPEPGTAEMSELAAAAMSGRVSDQPGAIHFELMTAVDTAGITYAVQLNDGEQRAERFIMTPDSGYQAGGYVVESLDRMISALAGVVLPARPDGLL